MKRDSGGAALKLPGAERGLPGTQQGLPGAGSGPPEGFAFPDWAAPLDLAAHVARIPPGATAKGMFPATLIQDVVTRGFAAPTDEAFYAFHDYPLSRCVELLGECAQLSYPELPLREGIRRMSSPAYTTFADTLIGRVIFASLAGRVQGVFKLASRAWRHAMSTGELETRVVDANTVIIHAADLHLPDCAAIAIIEGVLHACRVPGYVALKMTSHSDGEFWIRWGPVAGR